MKVSELIIELFKLDLDLDVYIGFDMCCNWYELVEVKVEMRSGCSEKAQVTLWCDS